VTKKSVTFAIGDRVVYPSQGAGVVEELTTREVLGERHEYLKVVFIKGNLEVLVPLTRADSVGLRPTIGRSELPRLYSKLGSAELGLPTAWPQRYRAEQEILARGASYELAELIGALAKRDLEKGLASTEREVMDAAKELLATELAVVTDTTLASAVKELDDLIAERIGQP
jgi:CarD family transcriptional regulator